MKQVEITTIQIPKSLRFELNKARSRVEYEVGRRMSYANFIEFMIEKVYELYGE